MVYNDKVLRIVLVCDLHWQRLLPAKNTWAAYDTRLNSRMPPTQFPRHKCKDDLTMERSFVSQVKCVIDMLDLF